MGETAWTHVGILALFLPVMGGIVWLIWQSSQIALKVDLMWEYLTNHKGAKELLAALEERRRGRGRRL